MKALAIAVIAAIIAMMIPVTTLSQPTIAQNETQTTNNDLPVSTFQDEHHIITTVTKSGEPPSGPIVIIPPNQTNTNGSVITPGDNNTVVIDNGTVTEVPASNDTVIIQPDGNVTTVPDANVTVVDNSTVVIAPPDRNVTTIPDNITVIGPPATELPPVKNCTCQQQNNTEQPVPGQPTIPPVQVIPAPGQNVTINQPENQTQPAENQTQTNPVENQTTEPVPFPPQPGNETNVPPIVNPPVTNQTGNSTNSNNSNPMIPSFSLR